MKHIITYLFLILGFASVYALPVYEYDAPSAPAFQSHKILDSGTIYKGTVYVPFDDAAPSDQSVVGRSYNPGHRTGGPKKGFGGGPESGQGPSPIGEPWILAAFAALFAGVIAWRRKAKKI